MGLGGVARRLLLPARERARAGWRFDVRAIEEAIDLLEIRRPVQVKLTGGRYQVGGHYGRGDHHGVTVSTFLGLPQASETLWHELVHAAQCERFENDARFRRAYRLEGKTGERYRTNGFEVEARQIAEAFAWDFPLVRP